MRTSLKSFDTVGYKVRLFPTKEQVQIFYNYFNMSQFVYNKCIDIQEEHYKSEGQFKDIEEELGVKINKRLSYVKLTSIFTKLKTEYRWLYFYDNASIRGAIRDCCEAYNKYDNKSLNNGKPRYKSDNSKKQFYTRCDNLTIDDDYITLTSIGKIRYYNSYGDEIIGCSNKSRKNKKYVHFYNPRISFDGIYFYLSFTIPKDQNHQINSYSKFQGNEEWNNQKTTQSIGIDVGLKEEKWLVDSTGRTVKRPNSDKLHKRISRMQRKYQRQKDACLKKDKNFLKQHPNGSKNMQKTRTRINKDLKKITNRRRDVAHKYACDLIKLKPSSIVMESNIPSTLIDKNANSKFNRMLYDAALYETTMIIQEKAISNGIKVIRANKNFPSSQICSCCGHIQNIGQRKNYHCPVCGTVINRDLNAAINLANYEHIKNKYLK